MANEVLILLRAIYSGQQAMAAAKKDVDDIHKQTRAFISDLTTASIIVGGFALAVKRAYDFSKEGAQIERLQATGTQLAKSFGVDMSEAVAKVKAASLGTISTVKAVGEVNRLMLLGITSDTETMAKLMQISALRGRAFGLSTEEAFDRITLGIGRLSTRILDDIGIVIKGQEAYDKYAKSIGKTADQLTGVEQRIALTNAIIEDGNKLLEASGGLTEDNATKFARLEAVTTDFANSIKVALSPALARAADALATILDMTPKIIEALAKQGLAVAGLKLEWIKLNKEVGGYLAGVVASGFGSSLTRALIEDQKQLLQSLQLQKALATEMANVTRSERERRGGKVETGKTALGTSGKIAGMASELQAQSNFAQKSVEIESDLAMKIYELNTDLARKREDIATDLARKLVDINTDLARRLQDIDTDLANKTADISNDHNDKMLDAEKNYQRKRKAITDRFELARLRALMDLDGRALFEAEQNRDSDLADAAQARAQKKKDDQEEYQRKLRDAALAAERERQQAQIMAQRQQADANQNYQRQIADARLAYARRYNDLSLASQMEFTKWVQTQQAITNFLKASYARQEFDYAGHLNTMNAMNTISQSGQQVTAPTQTGSLSLNVNVAGTGLLQQIVQQTTYNTMYDIFTLPGGQQVWKLRGL